MVQRITYRRKLSYNTKSNKVEIVKTPGNKLVFHYLKKKGSTPRCGDCGSDLQGLKSYRPFDLRKLSKCQRTIDRAYGGVKCGTCVRSKILRSFLIEEQKTAKLVLKKQLKQTKKASKETPKTKKSKSKKSTKASTK